MRYVNEDIQFEQEDSFTLEEEQADEELSDILIVSTTKKQHHIPKMQLPQTEPKEEEKSSAKMAQPESHLRMSLGDSKALSRASSEHMPYRRSRSERKLAWLESEHSVHSRESMQPSRRSTKLFDY